MSQKIINVGTTGNDNTGDKVRIASKKIVDNFGELSRMWQRPEVVVDHWFPSFSYYKTNSSSVGAPSGELRFTPLYISKRTSISHLMVNVTTSPGVFNVAIGIWASLNGKPNGAVLGYTASLSASATGPVYGSLLAGSGADIIVEAGWYQVGVIHNNSGLKYTCGADLDNSMAYLVGGLSDASVSTSTNLVNVGYGFATTFGSWPTFTPSSTFTEYTQGWALVWFKSTATDFVVPSTATFEWKVFLQNTQGLSISANSTAYGQDSPWTPVNLGSIGVTGNTTGLVYRFDTPNDNVARWSNGFIVDVSGNVFVGYDFVVLNECLGATRTFDVIVEKPTGAKAKCTVTVSLNTYPLDIPMPGVDFAVGSAHPDTLKSLEKQYNNGAGLPPTGWKWDDRTAISGNENYRQLCPNTVGAVLDGWDCRGFSLYQGGATAGYNEVIVNNCYIDASFMVKNNNGPGAHGPVMSFISSAYISNCTVDGQGFDKYYALDAINIHGGKVENCRVINMQNDGFDGWGNIVSNYIHCCSTNISDANGNIIQTPLQSPADELNMGSYWGHCDGGQTWDADGYTIYKNNYTDTRFYRTNPYSRRRMGGSTSGIYLQGFLNTDLRFPLLARENIIRGGTAAIQMSISLYLNAHATFTVTSTTSNNLLTAVANSTVGLGNGKRILINGTGTASDGTVLTCVTATGNINFTSGSVNITGTGTNFANNMPIRFPTASSTNFPLLNGVELLINKATSATVANLTSSIAASYTNVPWTAGNTTFAYATTTPPVSATFPYWPGPFIFGITEYSNNFIAYGINDVANIRRQSSIYNNRYIDNGLPIATYTSFNPPIANLTVSTLRISNSFITLSFSPTQNNTTVMIRSKATSSGVWGSWANAESTNGFVIVGGDFPGAALAASTSYDIEMKGVNYVTLSNDFNTFLVPNGVTNSITVSTTSNPTFETESTTLFTALPDQPSLYQKTLINDLIKTLKDNSIWSTLDFFYCFAMPTHNDVLINWKTPGTYTLVPFGQMGTSNCYSVNKWVTANNQLSNYYTTGSPGYRPGYTGTTTAASNTSFHMGTYVHTAGARNNYRNMGANSNYVLTSNFNGVWSSFSMNPTVNSNNLPSYTKVGGATSIVSSNGYFVSNRTTGTTVDHFFYIQANTTQYTWATTSRTAYPSTDARLNSPFIICGKNANSSGGYTPEISMVDKLAFAHCGSSLTSGQIGIIKSAMETYLIGIKSISNVPQPTDAA